MSGPSGSAEGWKDWRRMSMPSAGRPRAESRTWQVIGELLMDDDGVG